MEPRADEVIELLALEPLPGEGGYFRETYRAGEEVAPGALPARYGGERAEVICVPPASVLRGRSCG